MVFDELVDDLASTKVDSLRCSKGKVSFKREKVHESRNARSTVSSHSFIQLTFKLLSFLSAAQDRRNTIRSVSWCWHRQRRFQSIDLAEYYFLGLSTNLLNIWTDKVQCQCWPSRSSFLAENKKFQQIKHPTDGTVTLRDRCLFFFDTESGSQVQLLDVLDLWRGYH